MPQDDLLVVNFAALSQASGDISRAISALTSSLSDLESQAKPLVATWEGSARDAYLARQQQWNKASQDLTQILNEIKKKLDESAVDFAATEKRNERRFV